MKTNTIKKIAGASVLAVGLAIAAAPVAAADETSFLVDVHRNTTIVGQDGVLLWWGHAACNDIARGIPVDQIARNIYAQTATTYNDASWVVRDAATFLC